MGKDVRVPEWLMMRLSFGLESSVSDITVRMGKDVTAECLRVPPVPQDDLALFVPSDYRIN